MPVGQVGEPVRNEHHECDRGRNQHDEKDESGYLASGAALTAHGAAALATRESAALHGGGDRASPGGASTKRARQQGAPRTKTRTAIQAVYIAFLVPLWCIYRRTEYNRVF